MLGRCTTHTARALTFRKYIVPRCTAATRCAALLPVPRVHAAAVGRPQPGPKHAQALWGASTGLKRRTMATAAAAVETAPVGVEEPSIGSNPLLAVSRVSRGDGDLGAARGVGP